MGPAAVRPPLGMLAVFAAAVTCLRWISAAHVDVVYSFSLIPFPIVLCSARAGPSVDNDG